MTRIPRFAPIRRPITSALLLAWLMAVTVPGCVRSTPAPPTAPAANPGSATPGANGAPATPGADGDGAGGAANRPPAAHTAPVIRNLGISHERSDGGWLVIPGTVSLWAAVENADRVDFLFAPTGTEQTPARYPARRLTGEGHWALLHRTPSDPVLYHVWVEATGPGGTARSEVLSVMHERVEPGPGTFEGIPLFPSFRWNVAPSRAERDSLRPWLGQDYDAGGARVAVSGWLQQVSPVEVERFYLGQLEAAGWEVEGPVGGGSSWGMRAKREGRVVQVSFALGDRFGGPPSRPELGYRVAIVVRTTAYSGEKPG